MCRPFDMMLAIILVCCSITLTESTESGWTDPAGPIIQLKGSEIRIKCGVSGGGYPAKHLGFFNSSNSEFIDNKYVREINSSTIELVIENAEEQDSMIICKMNDSTGMHGISYNDVRIGHVPAKIAPNGVKCVSNNWRDMHCSFVKPYNPVPVNYSLLYRLTGSSQFYTCEPATKDPNFFSCNIGTESYRQHSERFEFVLSSDNSLGTDKQTFPLNNYESVIPAPPINLKVLKLTSNTITIRWGVNFELMMFPHPFDFEILVESQKDCNPKPKRYRLSNLSATDNSDNPSNFTQTIDLEFASTWYDISLRMKISTSANREEMWSAWTDPKLQSKSLMRSPDEPPRVDAGSFNIGTNGDVYIYWKSIPKCYQNGDHFMYSVEASNSEHPKKLSLERADYTKDQLNLLKDTTFSIRSVNSEGQSANASHLTIPGEARRIPGPTRITKILSNGIYHLSWSAPEIKNQNITSYTVFSCVSKSELPNSCEKSIDFVKLPSTQMQFTLESSQTINFAVSATTKDSTSGMIWARCTTANGNEIGKIKSIYISRVTATEIEVEWNLECTDSGIVAGYQLEYCPSKEPKTLECMEREKKINVTGGHDHSKYTLTDLMPYTTYKVVLRMFSNSTMGPASDPLANTTLEAAPSPVRKLNARFFTNTSVNLLWEAPEFSNGVLLYYKVWANQQEYKVEIDNAYNAPINYTLTGLLPFTAYDIAVLACTKECSESSRTKGTTTIGAPGGFKEQPRINTSLSASSNYTSAKIEWSEPEFKGGHLDYYEIKTKATLGSGAVTEHVIKTRQMSCFYEKMCAGEVKLYDFSVRAINLVITPHSDEQNFEAEGSNDEQLCDAVDKVLMKSLEKFKEVDPHGWQLSGPWSPAIGHSCALKMSDSKESIIATFSIISIVAMFAMIYMLYKKYNAMKDILVQMPPGLEDLTGDKKKGKELGGNLDKMGTPDILRNVDNTSINCEDENGQLLKKSLNGSLNADCSSSSMHSNSTRSEMDHMEHEDEIEYGEFGRENSSPRQTEGLQSFMINPVTGLEESPIINSQEQMPTSTPIADKCPKPNVIFNPKMSMPSNGYVTQPPPKIISPVPPNMNGYVTQAMFSPMQSSGGYTPLSAFRKPAMHLNSIDGDKLNPKTPIVATCDQQGISGYVTHKQLSDFGHRMQ